MSEEINVTSQEVTEENENEAVQIKLTRSEQREQVFMLLFSKSFTNTSVDNMVQDSSELFMGGVSALAQAEVEGIVSAKEELDEIISRYLGWTLSRISKPSLAILELAVYEIKYLDNVPASVAINEAVELAKKYTIDESGFVNGILGSFVRDNGEK
jgi:N utilization substance protein B